jgi:hypothetical protein
VGLRAAQEWLLESSKFHPGADVSGGTEHEGSCGDVCRRVGEMTCKRVAETVQESSDPIGVGGMAHVTCWVVWVQVQVHCPM